MDAVRPPPDPSMITTGLIVVSVLLPIVSAISIFFRVQARRASTQPLLSDDYWVIGSWFLTLGLSILVWYYAGKSGVNEYNVDFFTGTEASLELVYISSFYLQFPLAAVKIAVLLFYKRIFTTPLFKTAVWFTIGVVSVWGLLFFFLVLLALDPISFPLAKAGLRLDATVLGPAQVASSFSLDIIVLCLPLPVISRLNMKWERKVAVAFIFWLSAFCVVAAVGRLVLLKQSVDEVVGSEIYYKVANQTKQFIFMVLEPNCSILAACLPTYGPLVAGGRASEYLVRGVRSVFSLRSARSGGRSHPKQPRSGSRSASESQVEVHGVENWPGKGRREILVQGNVPPLPEVTAINMNGINVTSDVSVYRE
ncbi:Rhodopsin domain-containing protein [Madurella fahalii]|uniref:Rhodopsin domain-containing protein n=1 Tax=Madurella fahalii TaxID=1157608 RepID=A0ABQ0G7G0_9PEZI